jgi:hypothetical protein
MGYTTEFEGRFTLNKPLDPETLTFLQKFNETRRMARKLGPEYGIEGEFFVDGKGFAGQDEDSSIIDYNRPPVTQPGLWCKWRPTDDGAAIEWDGMEKFYSYVEWLKYLIANFLAPKGYVLSGSVAYQGERPEDKGRIEVNDNKVKRIRIVKKRRTPKR